MTRISEILHNAPEIAIAIAVGLGYLAGRLKIGPFSLGSTAGALLVGIALGIMFPGIVISPLLKSVLFGIFIFAVGFKVGPQFFNGLNRSMISQVVLSVVVGVACLITVIIFAKLLGLQKGMAAGLCAGACTQSAVIGTAGDALTRLGLSAEEVKRQQNDVAVGYAVTYIMGTVLVIFFVRDIAPRMLGIKLRDAARDLETRLAGGVASLRPGQARAYRPRSVRAFTIQASKAVGAAVKDLEQRLGGRCVIAAVRRAQSSLAVAPDLCLASGDSVLVAGRTEGVMTGPEVLGPEILGDSFDTTYQVVDAVITNKSVVGKTLGELAETGGHGVFLSTLVRGGRSLPVAANTVMQRGDLLTIGGLPADVARASKLLGYAETPTTKTDLLYLGVGIALGTLLGMITIKLANVPITLGAGGGVLVAGLVFGWLRSLHPTFGHFPSAAQAVFSDAGLNGFIAIVGLSAGPSAIQSIKVTGISLFLGGMAVAIIPQIAGLIAGKLMKMEPVVMLGALAGAQTVNAASNALTDEAQSDTPNLGFAVPYAVGNVLLTLWGPVIVGMV